MSIPRAASTAALRYRQRCRFTSPRSAGSGECEGFKGAQGLDADRDGDNVHDDIRSLRVDVCGLRAINVLAGREWFGRGSSRHALFPSCPLQGTCDAPGISHCPGGDGCLDVPTQVISLAARTNMIGKHRACSLLNNRVGAMHGARHVRRYICKH